jgi:hypothetical protein
MERDMVRVSSKLSQATRRKMMNLWVMMESGPMEDPMDMENMWTSKVLTILATSKQGKNQVKVK